MKKDNFIWWVLGGVGAVALWYYYKNNSKKTITQGDVVAAVIQEENDKNSTPFKAEYNIVMPSDLVSKRVKEKAAVLTAGRFEIQPERVQPPLYM
jgi:hypothetical protein